MKNKIFKIFHLSSCNLPKRVIVRCKTTSAIYIYVDIFPSSSFHYEYLAGRFKINQTHTHHFKLLGNKIDHNWCCRNKAIPKAAKHSNQTPTLDIPMYEARWGHLWGHNMTFSLLEKMTNNNLWYRKPRISHFLEKFNLK